MQPLDPTDRTPKGPPGATATERPRIRRASALGMCFGVEDALEAMENLEAGTATVHGELVHNELVRTRLLERGIAETPEGDRGALPDTPRVVITAHGVSDRERQRLQDSGKEVVDTTCPLVRRAHRAAVALSDEGRFVLVVGKPGHVEVRGLVGDLDRHAVVSGPEDVRDFGEDRIGIVCQTTSVEEHVARTVAAIEQANPRADVRFVDTVCEPTRARQRAARELIETCDRIVVVGGKNSNNTAALARRCREAGVTAWHVQGPEDLDRAWFEGARQIGLTAGTSTLEETVDAVEARLRELVGDEAGLPAARPR